MEQAGVEGGDGEAVRVRPARDGDAPAIHRLLDAYAALGLVRRRSPEDVRRSTGAFLVATLADEVVGCVAIRVHSPSLAEISSLAVDDGFHGRGIGRGLIEAAIVRGHAQGIARLFAFTLRDRLFVQLGFRRVQVHDFPQKLATDYAGFAPAAAHKVAVVLDLEAARTRADRPFARTAHDSAANLAATTHGSSTEGDMTATVSSDVDAIAILGGGNLGRALAVGWTDSGFRRATQIHITRRNPEKLAFFSETGFRIGGDNVEAVEAAGIVVIAVQPQQIEAVLEEIAPAIDPTRHRVISVVSGVSIQQLRERLGPHVPIVRAMPNTAVSIGQSMTCLSASDGAEEALAEAQALFDRVGRTLVIGEEMMIPATALCACGIAFFLRSIRAASQGGIEIGFHPEEALLLAAQTARGAAELVLSQGRHPESEIDQVTTPRGCTIAGLNEMEHQGFSSAMIKGILLSARKAEGLYRAD